MRKTSHSTARPGFTLVELMVVIGIITLLAAVLVVAIGRAGVKAREDATASLIKKVSGQVQERLEALDRLKSQPQWASDAQIYSQALGISANQTSILLLKNRMKLYFPQSFAEYAAIVDYSANFDPSNYQGALRDFKLFLDPQVSSTNTQSAADFLNNTWLPAHMPPISVTPHNPETESSAVLYYILTQGKSLGIPTMNPGDFKSTEIADTDKDGLQEFIDAWGRPLRFYRWPTRLIRCGEDINGNSALDTGEDRDGDSTLDAPGVGSPVIRVFASVLIKGLPAAAPPDPLANDQDDPTLLLGSLPNSMYSESLYHTPQTYHNFLIVSSGPDGQKQANPNAAFGLYGPTETATFGYLAQPILTTAGFDAITDNITNRNR